MRWGSAAGILADTGIVRIPTRRMAVKISSALLKLINNEI
jgi:hypothetical protein